MSEMPLWERRLRAPKMTLPTWSPTAPDRCVYETNVSGIWQVHTWDVATGETRQVSDHPVGVLEGYASIDGAGVVFWQEDTGDETGRWLQQAFEGGGNEPFLSGVPIAWHEGLAQAPGIVAAGLSTDDGAFSIYVSADGEPAKEIARSTAWMAIGVETSGDVAGLSADGTLLAIQHAEHGNITRPSLRIVDPRTGSLVAERGDGTSAVLAGTWSPVAGDQRLAVGHEPDDRERIAIWDLASGAWRDLDIDLPGDIRALHWFPDASALLVAHRLDGRDTLHRVDAVTGAATTIDTPPGTIDNARVRPDGEVWYRLQHGEQPGVVFQAGREEPILVAPRPAPPGRPFVPWTFANENGDRVQGWLVEPDGPKPWPTLFLIHGGPTSVDLDRWSPEVQAYVDAGFAVAQLNYRGSIGFGAAWRDALIGNIGWPEVADIVSGHDDLLAKGIADPARSVIAGWSWGGYLTLLMHGMHPERFISGVAGVPVADYESAYQDESPLLQAYDRALFGGDPADAGDLLHERSPLTYVDRVQAPLLILAGEHDSRCPLPQILNYVERLKARQHPHELYLFGTGHSSFDVSERIRQLGVVLDFLAQTVPGIARLPGVRGDTAEGSGSGASLSPLAAAAREVDQA